MKIVIVGAGKVGELLCRDLSLEGNDIILIEQDVKILEKILANNDIMGFVGSGVSYDAQMEAEVPKADVFIAVTEKDEINIIASVIAKKLGAKYTIARVRSTDYSSQLNFMTESLGIDLVINPELEAAKYIKQNIDFPEALLAKIFSSIFASCSIKIISFPSNDKSRQSSSPTFPAPTITIFILPQSSYFLYT